MCQETKHDQEKKKVEHIKAQETKTHNLLSIGYKLLTRFWAELSTSSLTIKKKKKKSQEDRSSWWRTANEFQIPNKTLSHLTPSQETNWYHDTLIGVIGQFERKFQGQEVTKG